MGTDTFQRAGNPPAPADKPENIVQTAARESRKPFVIQGVACDVASKDDLVVRVAVPTGWDVREFDDEGLRPAPRRTNFTAEFFDVESFLAYVADHNAESSAVWIDYAPRNSILRFTAVFDDHARGAPGWRAHKAVLTPRKSVEWDTWVAKSGHWQSQLDFATFIQENELDITAKEGYPTSLQMHQLATDFKYRAELVAKSAVRLMDGTTKLVYEDMPDETTAASLKLVEMFCIGVPVFEGVEEPAYRVDARLKVKPPSSGKLAFAYELVRADRVFAEASAEVLARVRGNIRTSRVYLGSGS